MAYLLGCTWVCTAAQQAPVQQPLPPCLCTDAGRLSTKTRIAAALVTPVMRGANRRTLHTLDHPVTKVPSGAAVLHIISQPWLADLIFFIALVQRAQLHMFNFVERTAFICCRRCRPGWTAGRWAGACCHRSAGTGPTRSPPRQPGTPAARRYWREVCGLVRLTAFDRGRTIVADGKALALQPTWFNVLFDMTCMLPLDIMTPYCRRCEASWQSRRSLISGGDSE